MNDENQPLEAAAASAEQQPSENETNTTESGAIADFDTFFEINRDKVRQALAVLMNEQAAPMGASETENESEIGVAPVSIPDEWEQKESELTAKEKELAEMEQQLNYRKLQYDTVKLLEALEMPTNISEFVIGADMKDTKRKIDLFRAEFDRAVQSRVSERLRGKTPEGGNISIAGTRAVSRGNIREIMTGGTK